jgi:hypothetical protein
LTPTVMPVRFTIWAIAAALDEGPCL